MYPLLTRGNRRDQIFLQDVDRHDFMKTLAEACQQTGWPVHAYCLTPNHHRLVAETPEPDLVFGQRGCDLKADIVVTGLPAASEPLGEDLLDAVHGWPHDGQISSPQEKDAPRRACPPPPRVPDEDSNVKCTRNSCSILKSIDTVRRA
jgi:hypothetical protein